MEQKFRRIAPGLYRREYATASGDASVLYYGRLKYKGNGGKRTLFALGENEKEAKGDWQIIKVKNRRGEDLSEYKYKKPEPKNTDALTFAEWADKYPLQEKIKDKRSLSADKGMIRLHLKPFFGDVPLTGITRDMLIRYIGDRMEETLIRNGIPSKKEVKRGTVSNELSCLRRVLSVAAREGLQVARPSFEDLLVRRKRGGWALSVEEREKVLKVYPKWLARLAEFATETGLSEGDLLRLTPDMVDRKAGVIVPENGRLKTQATTEEAVEQVAPLTPRARAIVDEIQADRKRGAIVANLNGLIFTLDDGRKISRDMISRAVRRAWKKAEVKPFVFHNYRNTVLSDWARRGISVDVAMKASGHTSVQMHKRYLDLQREDVAAAFGTGPKVEMVDTRGRHKAVRQSTKRVSA